MNARLPTTAWDRPVTDAELDAHCGKDKSTRVRDEIIETLTKTIRVAHHSKLVVPYVSFRHTDYGILRQYTIEEVVKDYGTEPAPMAALMAALEGSSCPLVEAYRQALAKSYADAWAEEVEQLKEQA